MNNKSKGNQMSPLIEIQEIKLASPACDPGSQRWSVFVPVEADLSEVMPYLNAVWKDAQYDHRAKVLIRRSGQHAIAIRPHEVAVSNALDRADAQRLVEELIAEINAVWQRRDEITPQTEMRRRPTAMEVYKQLPRTNCRACGQSSCYNFALHLLAGDVRLTDCAPLTEEARRALAELLGTP
ncbi:MAG: Fe-S cluster protein [Chloroflexi bacterium]|nr:Fe-S cluster protein [Chloroflexota bacterium]